VGIRIERRWIRGSAVRRTFTWLVVIGPAPLVLNEALQRLLLWVR
jgi:hypothetical protein